MKSALSIVRSFYHPSVQVSLEQAMVVAEAIVSVGPAANVLVFGCGRDSRMWAELAAPGRCLFVEDNPKWAEKAKSANPGLDILKVSYRGRTVGSSLPIDESDLAAWPIPAELRSDWDVIIIDGPNGFLRTHPGRSLPIYWTSKLARAETHVFIDDHNRKLERTYAERFFAHRPQNAEIRRVRRFGRSNSGEMLWSKARQAEARKPDEADARS